MRTPVSSRRARRWSQHSRVHGGRVQRRRRIHGRVAQPELRRPTAIRERCRTRRNCCRTWPRSNTASAAEIVNHYNVQPVFDVYANVDRRDLGGVALGKSKRS